MLYTRCFYLLLIAAFLSPGCTNNSSNDPAKGKIAEEERKLRDAASVEKRDEYAHDMHTRLNEINSKLIDLESRATRAEGRVKQELEKKLAQGKVKRDELARRLDELKAASADRWEKFKDGAQHAFDDMKHEFE